MAALLIEAGADLKLANIWGSTPLHLAAAGGHWDVARVLLKASVGAELVALRDKRGRTPGEVAVRRGAPVPEDLKGLLGITKKQEGGGGAEAKTLLVEDPRCSQHLTCRVIRRSRRWEPPPENVGRLKVGAGSRGGGGGLGDCLQGDP